MPKYLILNCSGAISCHDGSFSAHVDVSDPLDFFSKNDFNSGDLLVSDAILKIVNSDGWRSFSLSQSTNELAEILKDNKFDAAILRGSNYFVEGADHSHVNTILEALDCPIISFGVGVQLPRERKIEFTPSTTRFLKIISERANTIAVRGNFTAEMFNLYGAKNVDVIGCPSIFRSLRPSQSVREPIREIDDARLGITVNRMLSHDYTESLWKTKRMHQGLIEQCISKKNTILYSQGEREETLSLLGAGDRAALIDRVISALGFPTHRADIRELISARMVTFFDIESWSGHVAENVDWMIGFRLHGNVIALHQGIPAVFITYDTRIREIADLFCLPKFDLSNYRPLSLHQLLEKADFTAFEARYHAQYMKTAEFLDVNGIRHNLLPCDNTALKTLPPPYENDVGARDVSDAEALKWYREEFKKISVDFDRAMHTLWENGL